MANRRVGLAGYGYRSSWQRQPLLDSQERLASASIVKRPTPSRNRGPSFRLAGDLGRHNRHGATTATARESC